jgi:hypothetical protein
MTLDWQVLERSLRSPFEAGSGQFGEVRLIVAKFPDRASFEKYDRRAQAGERGQAAGALRGGLRPRLCPAGPAGREHNFVSLTVLRHELAGDRQDVDTLVRRLRRAGHCGLAAAQGRHGIAEA